ncbi:hypothetical protein CEXT_463851 [Caerostris extrusa]|uniref:Uncharacterized protein n=1 Tax=Caerostris extrusa TaxID=172846 RepID=A0AAV4NUL3_CAEEX|nr:hypothetical protein CEXT_463851 [Caerostris extrusa]
MSNKVIILYGAVDADCFPICQQGNIDSLCIICELVLSPKGHQICSQNNSSFLPPFNQLTRRPSVAAATPHKDAVADSDSTLAVAGRKGPTKAGPSAIRCRQASPLAPSKQYVALFCTSEW